MVSCKFSNCLSVFMVYLKEFDTTVFNLCTKQTVIGCFSGSFNIMAALSAIKGSLPESWKSSITLDKYLLIFEVV